MTQVLTVPNPLEMYDGCYAKQRDGEITGPWVWREAGEYDHGWYCDDSHRDFNGRWYSASSMENRDLIEVVPDPVTLPEPVERWMNVYSSGNEVYHETLGSAECGRQSDGKTYRVRIEFLEEVKP